MKFTNPIAPPLPKECLRAAKIFHSFIDENNNGLDGLIPNQVLSNAKGFAILTVLKAGVLFSARGGSGVVIARLEDGSWSAPSAVGIAGVGFGGQFGAEMAEIVIVLNSRSAIRSFMSSGSLTLGGSMSIALGPTGRNTQVAGAINQNGVAAMYTYSRTQGLFTGLSIEGSVLVERKDANREAYGGPVTVRMILGGVFGKAGGGVGTSEGIEGENGHVHSEWDGKAMPDWAKEFVKVVEECSGPPSGRVRGRDSLSPTSPTTSRRSFDRESTSDTLHPTTSRTPTSTSQSIFRSVSSATPRNTPQNQPQPPHQSQAQNPRRNVRKRTSFPPSTWGTPTGSGSFFSETLLPTASSAAMPTGSASRSMLIPGHQTHVRSKSTEPYTVSYNFTPGPPAPAPANTGKPSTSTSNPNSNSKVLVSPPPEYQTFDSNFHSSQSQSHEYEEDSDIYASSDGERDFPVLQPVPSPLAHTQSTPQAPSNSNLNPNPNPDSSSNPERVLALYDFQGTQPGDLSFQAGDVITVVKRSRDVDDWWTGKLVMNGKEGMFPANYVGPYN